MSAKREEERTTEVGSSTKKSEMESPKFSRNSLPQSALTCPGPSLVEQIHEESPARRPWTLEGSPMFRFPSSASPMIRMGLPSPEEAFRSADYMNRNLPDELLSRIPTADPQHMFVDAHGDLVTSGSASHTLETEDGLGFLPSAAGSIDAGERVSSKGQNSESSIEDVFPGSSKMPLRGFNSNALRSLYAKDEVVEEWRKDEASLTARVVKGAERKRLSTAPTVSFDHEMDGEQIGKGRKSRGLVGKKVDQGTKRSAQETGLVTEQGVKKNGKGKESKLGAGLKDEKLNADTETPRRPEYSEEELKRIRRVKNRASVEKCRTKQRKRMEALEVEMHCLRQENRNLEAVTKCILGTSESMCAEIYAATGQRHELNLNF